MALFLVGVPTFAGLFPGFVYRQGRPERIGGMLVWLAVAGLATIASQGRENAVHALTSATQSLLLRQHLSLLLSQAGIPDRYRFCVYLSEDGETGEEEELLMPWYPDQCRDSNDPSVFKVGQGATGRAFQKGGLVFAVGDAVSSGEFGLSAAQQEKYSDDRIVAAAPIRLVDEGMGDIVGTLSVISRDNDGFFVSELEEIQEDGMKKLQDLADDIGEVLSVEGIQWSL